MSRTFIVSGFVVLAVFVLCGSLLPDSTLAQETPPKGGGGIRSGEGRSFQQDQFRGRNQGGFQRGGRKGMDRGGRKGRGEDNSLAVGEMAPDFNLKSLEGDLRTQLSSFRGKKPVILFFGSYT